MNNKRFFIGLLCIAALACMVVFIGCENGEQDVNVKNWDEEKDRVEVNNWPQDRALPAGPATFTATISSDRNTIILRWDAVNDATGYSVYLRKVGTKTIRSISISEQNGFTYDGDGNPESPANTNPDKWAGLFTCSAATSWGMSIDDQVEFAIVASLFDGGTTQASWSNATPLK